MTSASLRVSLLLLVGSAAAGEMAATILVPPGELYFSEHNWALQSSKDSTDPVAVSVNSGAYIKTMFTGSTRASFSLEATKPGPTAVHYMNVVFSIDNMPPVHVPILGTEHN